MKGLNNFRPPRTLLRKITRISALSFIMVIMTFLGLYLGLYVDRITDMAPNFTFLGLLIGIAIGFKGFIDEVLVERRRES
ncbi:MAG: AtpZ/AtpI family protein [Desulfobacterota bacterium]|nr:AtpZ/AtpI family protein [Thermodesulfobacteriota bacterium]